MAEKTLGAMRRGGIFDQLGFGFHRYSTDRQWLVPHFEKMLYDQALLRPGLHGGLPGDRRRGARPDRAGDPGIRAARPAGARGGILRRRGRRQRGGGGAFLPLGDG